MEDYKKKYEELYERISSLVRDYDCVSGLIDVREELKSILNESQESEDERIRKWLIEYFKNINDEVTCEDREKITAWLEKQGEKVDAIENFNTEFERQISHLIASIINKEHEYNESFVKWTANALLNYAKHELEKQGEHKCDCKYVGCHVNNVKRWCHKKQSEILYEKCNIKCSEYLKQGEQKPTEDSCKISDCVEIVDMTEYNKGYECGKLRVLKYPEDYGLCKKPDWSEEDEKILKSIIINIENLQFSGDMREKYHHIPNTSKNYYQIMVIWLKSLKEKMKGE